MKSKCEQEGIVLNKMYTGWYLDENIGHEIINLFRADNNENYIYLCKDGTYSRKNLPKYTIQVRTYGSRTLEVISIAEIKERVDLSEIKDIKYGGKFITDIFKGNEVQGTATYITFKASRVIKPNPQYPVYIAYKGNRRGNDIKNTLVDDEAFTLNEIKSNGKYNFDVNEQMRNYIEYNQDERSDYSKLSKIISDAFKELKNSSGRWVAVDTKIEITADASNDDSLVEVTPAEIYGIGNLELPYSNAFRFFLNKYPKLLSGFCQYLKKYENRDIDALCESLQTDFKLTIKREWENIDILIEVDKEWVIIVENKIFSDLNGKVGKEITQLDKYYSIIVEDYEEWKKIFVLLTPNHNNIDIKQYSNWRKLFYSSVAKYLSTTKEVNTDRDLKAFATMIERHSDVDYNYGEMRRRFIKAINEAKEDEK